MHSVDKGDEVEVFVPQDDEINCKVKGLQNFSYMIDDFEERRIANPTAALAIAYGARENAVATAKKVMEEEAKKRAGIEAEIKQLEDELESKVRKESEALEEYRQNTNKVLCLEMKEPCRWNENYYKLKQYVQQNGELPPVPSGCNSEDVRRLSIWVQEMKSLVYSKSERITSAPHRIEALEALGIEWIESSETKWNSMYDKLVAYKKQHKTAKLPPFMECRRSKDSGLIALRHWLDQQEQDVKSGAMAKRRDRLHKLQALGLPLKLTWSQEWKYSVVDLLKFRSSNGHCYVTASCTEYPGLHEFVTELLKRLKRDAAVKLTILETSDLQMKGLLPDLRKMNIGQAGKPVSNILNQGAAAVVPLERVREVNLWANMFGQLKAYKKQFQTLKFPPPGDDDSAMYNHLSVWVDDQRRSYENKTLETSRVRELQRIGVELDVWDKNFKALRKFKKEAGTVRLPKLLAKSVMENDKELAEHCKWTHEQVAAYRKGQLDADQKKRLRKLGLYLTKEHLGHVTWEERFNEMMEYYAENRTCLPKRDSKSFVDLFGIVAFCSFTHHISTHTCLAGPLKTWVLELVDTLKNDKYLSQSRIKMISTRNIAPQLAPDVIFAKSKKESYATQNNKRKADTEGVGVAKKAK